MSDEQKFDEDFIRSIAQRRSQRGVKTVMTVEDDLFTRTLVATAIEDGISVVAASSGEEAISKYISAAPDIVFLDIGLPDISGYDVLSRLLKIDPQAFIVMLSGVSNGNSIMRSVSNGAKGFIVKPFTKEELLEYMAQC